ncbi:MAG: ABC transporter permease, partial [Balneolales bacterium]|nr:ABC transporter permease [Balneolales bacterium]
MENRKNHRPPFFGRWLLEKICPRRFYEDVEGDLHELYQYRLQKGNPKWIANTRFMIEVLTSYRLKSIQLNTEQTQHYDKDHLAMLKNYIKIAFRNIAKHKAYHALNIGGLAIGVASFLMIFLFVRFELSYDTWMLNSE